MDRMLDSTGRLVGHWRMVRICMTMPEAPFRCENEARYDSGLCGLHDILLNRGLGRLLSHERIESEKHMAALAADPTYQPGP